MSARISLLIASGLGVGLVPGAPGTYASLITALLFALVYVSSRHIAPELHVSTLCLLSFAGVLASEAVARRRGIKDPSAVVIDEIAGQLLTFVFVPVSALNLLLGFLLFRAMDIWKPFPIRRLESLPGGVGIMADDLLAGIYANLLLHAAALIG